MVVRRRGIVSIALIGLLAIAGRASADGALYVGLLGGGSSIESARAAATSGGTQTSGELKFKFGSAGGAAVGYAFRDGLQPELEFTYGSNNLKGGGGHADQMVGTASLYYNLTVDSAYFYAGGGGGYGHVKAHVDGSGGAGDSQGIYSAGAGFGWALTPSVLLGVDYRYHGAFSKLKFDFNSGGTSGELKTPYHAHLMMIGLRYSFGSVAEFRPPSLGPAAEPSPDAVKVVPAVGN